MRLPSNLNEGYKPRIISKTIGTSHIITTEVTKPKKSTTSSRAQGQKRKKLWVEAPGSN
jgi:hypothetical protein